MFALALLDACHNPAVQQVRGRCLASQSVLTVRGAFVRRKLWRGHPGATDRTAEHLPIIWRDAASNMNGRERLQVGRRVVGAAVVLPPPENQPRVRPRLGRIHSPWQITLPSVMAM